MHPITTALPATLCYLDGEYTALRDAKISVLDRGFIFGDGIYEVVPVYGGQPFCFEEHMARLARSPSCRLSTRFRSPNGARS